MLFNFLALEEVNVGLLAGVGIGANTFIINNSIDATKQRFTSANGTNQLWNSLDDIKDKTYTGFDAWVNVGIRTNFLQNHDIEVLAKIPFVGTTAYNKTIGGDALGANANIKLYMPWNVNLRYIYSF